MPIPDTPQTRDEVYLNAIATGDSSGIPAQPYTRKEMYLDAIARSGGGGGDGALAVNITWDDDYTTATLDKTWQEISDASNVVIIDPWDGPSRGYAILLAIIDGPNSTDGKYHVTVGYPNTDDTPVTFGKAVFKADSANGYPVYTAS